MTDWPKEWKDWSHKESFPLTVLKDPQTNSGASVSGTLTRVDDTHFKCNCGREFKINKNSFAQKRFTVNTFKGTFTSHIKCSQHLSDVPTSITSNCNKSNDQLVNDIQDMTVTNKFFACKDIFNYLSLVQG